MNIPQELKYTKEHEWVLLDDGVAVVGITDFAQSELGDIVFVELPSIGLRVKLMEPFGSVESVKSVSDLYSPVTGVVADVNTKLAANPDLVNSDPFGEGWMVRIEPSELSELDQLLTADEYAAYIGAEQA
ncbi:MAG TPA: glycine cleavage system protein GcvH [bacterium]|nr:glycine cleavage system protein GcvH [bacterium]